MFYSQRTDKTQRERDLEYELDRYREEAERRIEAEHTERAHRRRELDERYAASMRSADDWPEALEKQARLMHREATTLPLPGEPVDEWFADGAKASARGLEIWRELEDEKQPEIEALRAQIEAIQNGIRHTVGERLAKEQDSDGWRSIANSLLDEGLSPDAWLDW